MTTSRNYAVRVLATGFMVLVFFCVPLFWGRYACSVELQAKVPEEARHIRLTPSGLLPEALEDDPNADRCSIASASLHDGDDRVALGVVDYVKSKFPGGRRTDVLYYEPEKAWMYFDRTTGQLVFCDTYYAERKGRQIERVTQPYYAGPDGISDTPGKDLGRFRDPVAGTRRSPSKLVYDRKLRRFFEIDRENMRVRSGPELGGDVSHEPVGFVSTPEYDVLHVSWAPTMHRVPRESVGPGEPKYDYRFNMYYSVGHGYESVVVITASGRIDRLDRETLRLVPGKETLPAPVTLYGMRSARPDQLLAYEVRPVTLGGGPVEREYAGMVVASVSRQGTSMSLAVYGPNGKRVKSDFSKAVPYKEKARAIARVLDEQFEERGMSVSAPPPYLPSAQATLFDVPGGKLLALSQYVFENLHPLALTLASFFAVDHIEAAAGYRALFLMPNSFVAQFRNQTRGSFATQFSRAMLMMLPAIVLALLLAWRVVRDSAIMGLSNNARVFWFVVTLMFGLPAYLTYRLTRPAVALVTCANCGLPRRPDMDRCHRCNAVWDLPELSPPAWRVLDEGRSEMDVQEPPAVEGEEAAG